MAVTKAEAKGTRNAAATRHEKHGLHDYGSVGEAQVALQNSGIRYVALDHYDQNDMAEWMWRSDASPQGTAIAFGLKLPGGLS